METWEGKKLIECSAKGQVSFVVLDVEIVRGLALFVEV